MHGPAVRLLLTLICFTRGTADVYCRTNVTDVMTLAIDN